MGGIALLVTVAVGCGGASDDPSAEATAASSPIALPPDEQATAGGPSTDSGIFFDSLADVLGGSNRGVLLGTVVAETPGRSGEDRGEGFVQLSVVTVEVERSFTGDAEPGTTMDLEQAGWYTNPAGERSEDNMGGCVRLRVGQRVLVGAWGTDEGASAPCTAIFLLEAGQVVDTGRMSPFIRELEAGSEADLIAAVERLVAGGPPPTTIRPGRAEATSPSTPPSSSAPTTAVSSTSSPPPEPPASSAPTTSVPG